MIVLSQAPEACASANSAIPAYQIYFICFIEQIRKGKMNILFIDDNSTIQKVNILMLRKFQYLKAEDKIFFRKSLYYNLFFKTYIICYYANRIIF